MSSPQPHQNKTISIKSAFALYHTRTVPSVSVVQVEPCLLLVSVSCNIPNRIAEAEVHGMDGWLWDRCIKMKLYMTQESWWMISLWKWMTVFTSFFPSSASAVVQQQCWSSWSGVEDTSVYRWTSSCSQAHSPVTGIVMTNKMHSVLSHSECS